MPILNVKVGAINRLTTKGLLILIVRTSGLQAAGMPGGYNPHCPSGGAKVVAACKGDLAPTMGPGGSPWIGHR